MNVRQTANLQAFADLALPFLQQQEAAHNLLLALLYRLLEISDASPRLITIERDRQIIGVAMQIGSSPLLLSRMTEATALDALTYHLKHHWHSRQLRLRHALPRFAGPKLTVALLAESLRRQTRLPYRCAIAMGIYKLTQVQLPAQPLALVAGRLRPAGIADCDRLRDWCEAFELESFGELRDNPTSWAEQRLEQGNVFLWDVPIQSNALGTQAVSSEQAVSNKQPVRSEARGGDQQAVSMVVGNAFASDGGCIGPVYTPPEHRRQGYGTAAVAALSQQLLDQGCQACYLFADLANPTANHIYQQIGYELVADWDEFEFSG